MAFATLRRLLGSSKRFILEDRLHKLHTAKKDRKRARLLLEALEDRCVPATFHVSLIGLDTNTGGTGDPFRTVQAGINAAAAAADGNDVVKVEAGTYATAGVDLAITIPNSANLSSLQLRGGWDALFTTQSPGTTEYTFQNAASLSGDLNILDSDVTINGFTWVFDGLAGAGATRTDSAGFVVQATNAVIEDNEFEISPRTSGSRPTAIQTSATNITGLLIQNNTFQFDATTPNSTSAAVGIFLNPDTPGRVTPVVVNGNTFQGDNLGSAIVIKDVSIINFTNNKVTRTGTSNTFLSLVNLRQTLGSQTGVNIDSNDLTNQSPNAVAGAGILTNGQTAFGSPTFPLSASITLNNITGNAAGLAVDSLAGSTISAHYNSLTGNGTGIFKAGTTVIDTTCNWWGDLSGPTVASNVGGSGQSITGTDAASVASVQYAPWLFYSPDTDGGTAGVQLPTSLTVTAGADVSPAVNNYRLLANAIGCVVSGQTVTLSGNFDWTAPNAAAAWALGNDGQTGGAFSDDDYSVLVHGGVNNVTLTAASLGGATIQGPGDLATVNLEGFLSFAGGAAATDDNQGWTISNLTINDFDLSIGMFNSGAGTDAFDGTTITNNAIRIPADLNVIAAPADANQNIGIHYSFGANQTISNNTLEIVGSGLSAASPNFSSSVGMQSNTSGGAVYDGLLIDNNTINVTGVLAAQPSTVLGIWENAHAHSSDITVSNNDFFNLTGANAATNLMRAFRVTSHSSATTTVAYTGNTVSGANIGFQWIAGSNFTGNQAVRLAQNTITGSDTAILVQSNGVANLFQNTISGGAIGVNVSAGSLTAAGAVTNSVEQNSITTTGDAVLIGATSTVVAPIFNNVLNSTGAGEGVNNLSATLVDASANFWGTNTPTGVAGKVAGSVDYTPWLHSGTDTSGTAGFQGDFSVLNVDDDSPQAGLSGRITEAIGLLTATGTVNVHNGTYTENVSTAGKAVTLAAGASPGQVTLNGNFTLDNNDTLAVNINGSIAGTGYDQWIVNGTVTLNNAALAATGTRTANAGDVLVLIKNDLVDAVTGTFLGLPEGSTTVVNGVSYVVTYKYDADDSTFGDGNDVALIDNSGSAQLITDPCDPTKVALVVAGTSLDDNIDIKLKGKTQVEVTIDPKGGAKKITQTFNLSAITGHIIVYGLNGKDDITVDNKLTQEAWLFGGDGDDHLQAGGGNSLLLGEAGDDHLQAGKGRDVLIGGTGKDHLQGMDGEDILIAGTTDHDNNVSALCNITMQWGATGPGTGYNARVTALSSVLNTTTVHDDGVEDHLQGGSSSLDWFLANVTGAGVKDKITGLKAGEIVTDI